MKRDLLVKITSEACETAQLDQDIRDKLIGVVSDGSVTQVATEAYYSNAARCGCPMVEAGYYDRGNRCYLDPRLHQKLSDPDSSHDGVSKGTVFTNTWDQDVRAALPLHPYTYIDIED